MTLRGKLVTFFLACGIAQGQRGAGPGSSEVNTAVSWMDEGTQQNAAGAEESVSEQLAASAPAVLAPQAGRTRYRGHG